MKIKRALLTATIIVGFAGTAWAGVPGTVTVGGAPMYPTKNIVQNAVNSKDNTTLVAAVKAAGLVPALEGKGPFTVFAPTNEAFNLLPAGTVPGLLQPAHKAELKSILLYHVVSGDYTFRALTALIRGHGGKATLKTLNGAPLIFTMNGPHNIVITDAKGDNANIIIYNVKQSNGVIQVINRVLMP